MTTFVRLSEGDRTHPHVAGAGFPRSAPEIVITPLLVAGRKG